MHRTFITAALALGAGIAPASARPIVFTIDDTLSSVDLEITLSVDGLGPNTDSDTSPVSGFVL